MKIIKIFIALFLILLIAIGISLFLPMRYAPFDTLADLKKYASFFPELPTSDTDNWENPTYENFYNQYIKIPFLKRLLVKLRLDTHLVLNLYNINELLKKITDYRIQNNMKSPFDTTIYAKKNARCFVWGNLHGAFHSLVKDLSQLQKMGIITNNLEIIKDIHFIFLGNAISRSPYSIETLTTILLLMEKNPKKIFYLKGDHETNGYWKNFNMRKDLITRMGNIVSKKRPAHIPLEMEIDQFFMTLPDMLFLIHKNEKLVCCHSLNNKNDITNDLTVKVILSGEKSNKIIPNNKGLQYFGFLKGISLWKIVSCPTEIYKNFFDFHYDTFVELSIGPTIAESVLTLYSNDITKKEIHFTQTYYQAMFGYPLSQKKSNLAEKNIINIGSTGALIPGLHNEKEIKEGLETAIITFNSEKNKNLIRLVFLNNKNKPNLAKQNINTLYNKYGIDILIIPSEIPTLELYLDMLTARKIVVLFPTSGSQKFRNAELANIIHFRGTYAQEAIKLIQYLTTNFNISKFAFFYPAKKPIINIIKDTLQKHGISQWLEVPYAEQQRDFSDIVKKIKKYKPEAIGFFADSFETKEVMSQLGAHFLFKRINFFLSILDVTQFKLFLEKMGLNGLFSTVTPDPETSESLIAKEYTKAMKKRGLPLTINSFQGYIIGSLFIDAIYHITPPVTKGKIMAHFGNMKNYSFKGLNLTFNPQTRDLSQPVGIKEIKVKH